MLAHKPKKYELISRETRKMNWKTKIPFKIALSLCCRLFSIFISEVSFQFFLLVEFAGLAGFFLFKINLMWTVKSRNTCESYCFECVGPKTLTFMHINLAIFYQVNVWLSLLFLSLSQICGILFSMWILNAVRKHFLSSDSYEYLLM